MQHPAQNARRVLDGFATPAQLQVVGIEEQGVATPSSRMPTSKLTLVRVERFGKNHAPAAMPERMLGEAATRWPSSHGALAR